MVGLGLIQKYTEAEMSLPASCIVLFVLLKERICPSSISTCLYTYRYAVSVSRYRYTKNSGRIRALYYIQYDTIRLGLLGKLLLSKS